MASETPAGCGCPPTAPAVPGTGGVHHVFLTVNDLSRSRAFYRSLMPRLGYPGIWEAEGAPVVGWLSPGGSVWIKQADPRYAGDTFSKDRVGLLRRLLRRPRWHQARAGAHPLMVAPRCALRPRLGRSPRRSNGCSALRAPPAARA